MDFSWIENNRKRVEADESMVFHAALGQEEIKQPMPTFKDNILNSSSKSLHQTLVGASDPGRQRDSFFFVGLQYEAPKILVVAAKRWLGHSYLSVEEKIVQIHREFKYDHQVIEVNNTGIAAYEVLHDIAHLPITGYNTSKDLNIDPRKKLDPFKFESMDKNDMARWMFLQKEMGNIVIPKPPSKDMLDLMNQWSNIIEHKSEGTGSVSYRAEGQEHDDGYMALMLGCKYIRDNLMNPSASNAPVSAGVSYDTEDSMEPNDKIISEIKKRINNQFNVEDIKVDFPT